MKIRCLKVFAFLVASACFAGEEPAALPDPAEIRGAVDRLAHERIEIRQEAEKRLIQWGAMHPREILQALPAENPDLEVESVLDRLRQAIPIERLKRKVIRQGGKQWRAIVGLLDNPAPEAIRAFSASAPKTPESAEVMLVLLPHPDPEVRSGAIQALATLGVQDALPEVLVVMRQDPCPSARGAAISAAVSLGGRSVSRQVLELVRTDDPTVRESAWYGLLSLKDPSLAEDLFAFLTPSRENLESGAILKAIYVLAETSVPPVISRIRELLESGIPPEREAEIKTAAMQALARLSRESAPEAIAKILSHQDPKLRCEAAFLLATMGSSAHAPALAKFLDGIDEEKASSDWEGDMQEIQRSVVIFAVGKMRYAPAAAKLTAIIRSRKNASLLPMAADAIGRLGERSAAPALAELIAATPPGIDEVYEENPSMRARSAAAVALGRLGDASYAGAIASLIPGGSDLERVSAARGLAYLSGRKELLPLESLSTDAGLFGVFASQLLFEMEIAGKSAPENSRDSCFQRFSDQTTKRKSLGYDPAIVPYLPGIAELLSHNDPGVRETAVRALGGLIGKKWPEGNEGVDLAKAWWKKERR